MSSAQPLPPKMAQQFADKAKAGLADKVIGKEPEASYEFNVKGSTNRVVLVSLDPPIGFVTKGNT